MNKGAIIFSTELLAGLFMVIAFSLFIPVVMRCRHRRTGVHAFLPILFLVTWVGGILLTPVGPLSLSVPWLGFLLIVLVFGLLIAGRQSRRDRPPDRKSPSKPSGTNTDNSPGEKPA